MNKSKLISALILQSRGRGREAIKIYYDEFHDERSSRSLRHIKGNVTGGGASEYALNRR